MQEQIGKENVKVGSIIPFGNYNWLVLDLQDGKALLLSEKVIESRQYHTSDVDITWETCTLRVYLNEEFLQAFTGEAQERIVETRLSNDDNLWHEVKGGNDTNDKIFLLSLAEVDQYFGNSGDYQNKRQKDYNGNTSSSGYYFSNAHDKDRQAVDANGEACWWWLRSPGNSCSDAALVIDDGSVNVIGDIIYDYSGGVRPALWLDIKIEEKSK